MTPDPTLDPTTDAAAGAAVRADNSADRATAPTDLDGIGYADAVDELDGILRDLERGDVDVDVLAERVQRAADLIALCRQRVDSARHRIDQVVADLDAAPTVDGDV